MFSIGPPKSASDSETSSRSDSPSKGSEWSTTSEPHVQPKTPQKLKYDSSSDGEWSDQSDTPVKPRTLRRSGRVLLPGLRNSSERSLPRDSDEISSLRLSDEGSSLRSSDDGSPRRASDDDSPSKESSEGLVFPFAGSDYDTDVVLQQVQDFPTSEHWVTQWDPKDTDFFNSGQIPVRPFPRVGLLFWFPQLDSLLIICRSLFTLNSTRCVRIGVCLLSVYAAPRTTAATLLTSTGGTLKSSTVPTSTRAHANSAVLLAAQSKPSPKPSMKTHAPTPWCL